MKAIPVLDYVIPESVQALQKRVYAMGGGGSGSGSSGDSSGSGSCKCSFSTDPIGCSCNNSRTTKSSEPCLCGASLYFLGG